jgi:hypothetical protein
VPSMGRDRERTMCKQVELFLYEWERPAQYRTQFTHTHKQRVTLLWPWRKGWV